MDSVNYRFCVANSPIMRAAGRLPLLFLCVVFTMGCGSSKPSDGQARKVVESRLQPLTQMGAKITDFRKLNAESRELEGQKVYLYHYLAAADLPAGVAWQSTAGSMIALASGGGFVKDSGQKGSIWVGHFTSLPKGTTAVSKGTITFRLTEKGWLSANVPDNAAVAYCTDKGPADCYHKLGWDTLE